MRKQIVKGSTEHCLFVDFWQFRQEYHDAESEEFFAKFVEEGGKIIKKYEKTEVKDMARNLIFACYEDTERHWKENKRYERSQKH